MISNKGLDTAIVGFFAFFAEKTAGNLVHSAVISDTLAAFVALVAGISAGAGQFVVTVAHDRPPVIFCHCNFFVANVQLTDLWFLARGGARVASFGENTQNVLDKAGCLSNLLILSKTILQRKA